MFHLSSLAQYDRECNCDGNRVHDQSGVIRGTMSRGKGVTQVKLGRTARSGYRRSPV